MIHPIRSLKHRLKNLARKLAGEGEIALYHHRFDQMATKHNDGFRREPGFVSAYARAVQAGGWDYAVPWRIHQHLWCADLARRVEGDVVELGTARGFFMSAVMAAWPDWSASGRSLHLFDTFDPAPPGKNGNPNPVAPYYAESFEAVRDNFAEWPRVHIYRGDVFETLPAAPIGRIALLHIDLNHHEPEVFGLKLLWDRVSPGGVLLLDDYAYRMREPQYEAMNEVAGELGISIMSTATGQGIAIK